MQAMKHIYETHLESLRSSVVLHGLSFCLFLEFGMGQCQGVRFLYTAQDFLRHVGIPPGTKLTRTEWAALRAALGTPRRLSLNFLRQVCLPLPDTSMPAPHMWITRTCIILFLLL